MKKLLSICLILISTATFAQTQFWKNSEHGKIPDGLKEAKATLVIIKYSNDDITKFGLHEKFTQTIYNKYVVKYAEKYFSGKKEFMSMSEFTKKKDEIDFVFLPTIYEPGRAAGIAPRLFGVVDVKNKTAYTRNDISGLNLTAGSMKSEILLEMKFIKKQRDGK